MKKANAATANGKPRFISAGLRSVEILSQCWHLYSTVILGHLLEKTVRDVGANVAESQCGHRNQEKRESLNGEAARTCGRVEFLQYIRVSLGDVREGVSVQFFVHKSRKCLAICQFVIGDLPYCHVDAIAREQCLDLPFLDDSVEKQRRQQTEQWPLTALRQLWSLFFSSCRSALLAYVGSSLPRTASGRFTAVMFV
jgi:hypothetical protein